MNTRRPALLAALGFFLLALAQAPAALTGAVYWSHDLRHHHLPWREWVAQTWARGELPLWCDRAGLGFPLASDGQVGLYYPPNLALGLLLDAPRALTFSLLLHSAWAGLGAWSLARALGLGASPAALAGVGYMLSGFMVSHANYVGMHAVAAWFPWALLTLRALTPGRSAPLALCIAALLTAGHVQVAAFVGLAMGALALLWRVPVRPLLGAGALGLSPALAQLLSSRELAQHSDRSGGVDPVFAAQGSLPPTELVNALWPRLWGWEPPSAIPRTYLHKGEGYFGLGESHWETCFYLGVPVILLALVAPRARAWWGLALGAILLMFGRWTPAWELLRLLPGFDLFRFPVRFSVVLTLAFGVLAAMGLQRLLHEDPEGQLKLRLARRSAVVALLIVALGALLSLSMGWAEPKVLERLSQHEAFAPRLDRVTAIWRGLRHSLGLGMVPFFAVSLAFAGLLSSWRRLGAGLGPALVGLLILDLGGNLWGYNPLTPLEQVNAEPAVVKLLPRGARIAIVDRTGPAELDGERLSASLSLRWGLHDVLVPSPLHISAQEQLLERAGLGISMDPGYVLIQKLQSQLPLIRAMSVQQILSRQPLQGEGLKQLAQLPLSGGESLWVYTNTLALPRARVYPCTFKQMQRSDCIAEPYAAEILQERSDTLTLRARGPGVLVLADTWYPGWYTKVDEGFGSPPGRLGSFRAVEIPAGEHELRMVYAPYWRDFARFSALAWVVLMLLGLLQVSRAKKMSPAPA